MQKRNRSCHDFAGTGLQKDQQSGQYQQERKRKRKDGFQAHYLIGVYFDSFPLFEKRGFGVSTTSNFSRLSPFRICS